jgi:hypothetical protein
MHRHSIPLSIVDNQSFFTSVIFHCLPVVQFVLQLCHVFCSCAFCFADVLKLYIIPTYNFADVQMK